MKSCGPVVKHAGLVVQRLVVRIPAVLLNFKVHKPGSKHWRVSLSLLARHINICPMYTGRAITGYVHVKDLHTPE